MSHGPIPAPFWFLCPAFLIVSSICSPAWGVTSTQTNAKGVFTSVSGKVKIKSQEGKTREAHSNSTVKEGEQVTADVKSSATLRLFDGSELKISPDTRVVVSKLQKKSEKDKKIDFKLLLGRLLAKVKKLATSNSSFEVEAGGVVCGVRGTEFSLSYDPKQKKVDLSVLEGTVLAKSGGQSNLVNAGQKIEFLNGKPNNAPTNPSPAAKQNKPQEDVANATVLYPSMESLLIPTPSSKIPSFQEKVVESLP